MEAMYLVDVFAVESPVRATQSRKAPMSQSLARLLVHIIFSTKNRSACLSSSVRPRLWRYLAGGLDALDSPAIQIGGAADHIHILCRMSKNIAACKLVEEIKKESSKWLKTQDEGLAAFYWQTGYGSFSIGQSAVAATERYILRQEEHHQAVSFQDEYRRFLARYEIPYDERYVWD
jgi:putative transposase